MHPRLQISGIASQHEAQLAIAAGAHVLGLAETMSSGLVGVDDQVIRTIAQDLPVGVCGVLLTQERTAQAIAAHVVRCAVSTVQVVNNVDPCELSRLRNCLPFLRIVQVIHVEGPESLELLSSYEPYVHSFLLDSGSIGAPTPLLGGISRAHDWTISAEFVRRANRPVFLAGGLRPGNVAEAIRIVRPYGLDICSGIRTSGGRLDASKLAAYAAAVRASPRRSPSAALNEMRRPKSACVEIADSGVGKAR